MPSAPFYEIKETLLSVQGVSKSLGGRLILRDVNVEIKNIIRPGLKQGQVVGFLGPSGMGKTTLFRLIAGIEDPDQGVIHIGADQRPVQKGQVGVVPQSYPLFNHRNVMSNLLVAGKQIGLAGSELTDKAEGYLKRFGLEGEAEKYPMQLSGGQRQRVAIAQQFMCSEHLVLMDEPFSGLDVNAIKAVTDLICEVASEHEDMSLVLVTHDISSAIEVSDTLWILGRDRDDSDKPIPGARIVKKYDLIELGIAWTKGNADLPEFVQLEREIKGLFPKL
ncbi:MAG: ATP-binding cassette domain-containing protein [Armatimonadetes bacterium]|nr:ATP-binding cassette domain-containing protein [Armatimonadota bacterium]